MTTDADTIRRLDRLEAGVQRLETELTAISLVQGVGAESQKNIMLRLDKIENTLSKLVWLLIGGIISSVVAFMISGGFSGFPTGG